MLKKIQINLLSLTLTVGIITSCIFTTSVKAKTYTLKAYSKTVKSKKTNPLNYISNRNIRYWIKEYKSSIVKKNSKNVLFNLSNFFIVNSI